QASELAADGEAETSPAMPSRPPFLRLNEGSEDGGRLLGGDTDPCIFDLQCDPATAGEIDTGRRLLRAVATQCDRALRLGELDRVGEEVDENLPNTALVAYKGDL